MPLNSSRRAKIDRLSTDMECNTPSSRLASLFQPHLPPPGFENIKLDPDAYSDGVGNVTQGRKSTYSPRWKGPENELLARCWVNISENSVISNAQKLDHMWKRIAADYNKNRPPVFPKRNWAPMKTHFYTAQKFVSAFNTSYISLKENWGSGRSDADIMLEALQQWEKSNNGQNFNKLIGMWKVLSVCPKWINLQDRDYRGEKKLKNSESGTYTSSSNNEDDDPDHTRLIGQKTAKKKDKAKIDAYDEINATIDSNMEEYKTISLQKIAELKVFNQAKDYDIFMRDTTGMTLEQLRVHNQVCEEIKKRRGWGV